MWNIFRKLFFLIPPETAHHLSMWILKLLRFFGKKPILWISGQKTYSNIPQVILSKEVCGVHFRNPLGLAAGFDKNAEYLDVLSLMGFGFVEIGTVTPRPQTGNMPPRLFRLPEQKALFNKMGFNNLGAIQVSENLKKVQERLPKGFRVGVNIGKNKETPNENAFLDYAQAIPYFQGLCDYIVINVSSPNTAGLRDLQSARALTLIVTSVAEVVNKWIVVPPLFIKLAPEITQPTLIEITEALKDLIQGFILTNTLMGEITVKNNKYTGGYSGSPLSEVSRERLKELRHRTQKPIISVGGIMTAEEAVVRISEGADLIQLYTGWVYGGPNLPTQILHQLDQCTTLPLK